jgi:hypothetical protein
MRRLVGMHCVGLGIASTALPGTFLPVLGVGYRASGHLLTVLPGTFFKGASGYWTKFSTALSGTLVPHFGAHRSVLGGTIIPPTRAQSYRDLGHRTTALWGTEYLSNLPKHEANSSRNLQKSIYKSINKLMLLFLNRGRNGRT